MPCYRCAPGPERSGQGGSPWAVAVVRRQQVLVCPVCQEEHPGWVDARPLSPLRQRAPEDDAGLDRLQDLRRRLLRAQARGVSTNAAKKTAAIRTAERLVRTRSMRASPDERLLGKGYPRSTLRNHPNTVTPRAGVNHIAALKEELERIETAQARLITKLELDDDPEGILFQRVRSRLSELEHERREKIGTLKDVEASKSDAPDEKAVDMLDKLPLGESRLLSAPEGLLRQAFRCPEARRPVQQRNESSPVLRDHRRGVPGPLPETLPTRSQRSARCAAPCTDVLRAPARALPTSVQEGPADLRRRLVVQASFQISKSPWAC
jgi:hypothetical protein